jgi:hypothetical protein
MPDLTTIQRLRGLVLSANDLKTLTDWPDPLIEDYLTILDNIITIAEIIDSFKIEAIPTDFSDGSIPFAESELLAEDSDLFWDNVNKRLGIGTNTPTATLDIVGTVKLPTTGISGAGTGSGLDSDLLDGHDSTYFAEQTVLSALLDTVSDLSDTVSDLSDAFDIVSDTVDDIVTWKATGFTGSFTNGDDDTVTVVDGLITGIT